MMINRIRLQGLSVHHWWWRHYSSIVIWESLWLLLHKRHLLLVWRSLIWNILIVIYRLFAELTIKEGTIHWASYNWRSGKQIFLSLIYWQANTCLHSSVYGLRLLINILLLNFFNLSSWWFWTVEICWPHSWVITTWFEQISPHISLFLLLRFSFSCHLLL